MFSLNWLLRGSTPSLSGSSWVGPIGMELAQEEIRMVQLRKTQQGGISLVARSKLPYSGSRQEVFASPGRVRKLVRAALKSGSFSGKRVVTALPPEEVKIIPLSYPNSSKGDEQTILELVAARIDGKLEDFMIDYLPIRANPGDEDRLTLVAMARKQHVVELLNLLDRAGLEVMALDIGPAAIKRLFSSLPGASGEETVLVINSGREVSYLTMVSGRRLLLDQQVEFGEEPLLQHLCKALDIGKPLARKLLLENGFDGTDPPAGESLSIVGGQVSETLREIFKPLFLRLIEEINRVLIFSASETRGNPVARIYLLGSIASWRGADELLGSLLDIPVIPMGESLRALEQPVTDEQGGRVEGIRPEMVIATGLALRGMEPDA